MMNQQKSPTNQESRSRFMDNTPIQPEQKFSDSINPSEPQVISEQIDKPEQNKTKSGKSLNVPKVENSSIRVRDLENYV